MEVVPFIAPCTISISGCTGSGKTHFVRKLLNHREKMFQPGIKEIIYCYSIWQEVFEEMEKDLPICFHEGLMEENEMRECDPRNHTTIVIDDLQLEISKSKSCEKLLTQISHHKCVTVIYVVQNMFYPGMRTLTLYTHYNIVFRNLRDIGQISRLGRQVGFNDSMLRAYKDAISQPYRYLVVDLSPHQKEEAYRLRSNIFPNEYTIVYKIK
jgi:Cdc6-like AAA superfamily ATPase